MKVSSTVEGVANLGLYPYDCAIDNTFWLNILNGFGLAWIDAVTATMFEFDAVTVIDVDKKQSERKQILSQFMDIDIFEQLESIAKSDSNEERIMLKQFQKKDSYKELGTINQDLT